jgi:hypothetical protein
MLFPANSANSVNSASPGGSAFLATADAPRQLEDDVLQSAEEAVLVDAGVMKPEDFSASRTVPETAGDHHQQNFPSRSLYEEVIRRYVAAQPYQSALLAAVAGALVAQALRTGWHHGRRAVKWSPRTR